MVVLYCLKISLSFIFRFYNTFSQETDYPLDLLLRPFRLGETILFTCEIFLSCLLSVFFFSVLLRRPDFLFYLNALKPHERWQKKLFHSVANLNGNKTWDCCFLVVLSSKELVMVLFFVAIIIFRGLRGEGRDWSTSIKVRCS